MHWISQGVKKSTWPEFVRWRDFQQPKISLPSLSFLLCFSSLLASLHPLLWSQWCVYVVVVRCCCCYVLLGFWKKITLPCGCCSCFFEKNSVVFMLFFRLFEKKSFFCCCSCGSGFLGEISYCDVLFFRLFEKKLLFCCCCGFGFWEEISYCVSLLTPHERFMKNFYPFKKTLYFFNLSHPRLCGIWFVLI